MEAIIGFLIYFIPTIVAYRKKCNNAGNILIINLLGGWTIIGWFIALAMATDNKKTNEDIQTGEYPLSVTSQLLPNEQIHYFSYISFVGGCYSNSSRTDHYVVLTNKRFLYKSKIQEDGNIKFIEKNGIIPFEKISFIEVINEQDNGCGCAGTKYYGLNIGSSGGTILIPIPTEEKGFEIRKVYMELLELQKEKNKNESDK